MKGVLMEKKGRYGVFMTRDGEFVKGKHKDNAIGEEFEIDRQLEFHYRKFVAVAIVTLMLIIGFGPMGVYADPYGFIELDINPSVELSYNRSMKIIKVSPLNDDGKALLEEIDTRLKGTSLDKAMDILLKNAKILNYDLKNVVIVYTKLDDFDETKIEKVMETIQNNNDDTITILDVDKEKYKELKENNIPPAMTVLKSKLVELNVPEEEYANIDKVSELAHIMNNAKKVIQEEKREEKGNGQDKENKQDKGNPNNNSGGNNNPGNNPGNNDGNN